MNWYGLFTIIVLCVGATAIAYYAQKVSNITREYERSRHSRRTQQ